MSSFSERFPNTFALELAKRQEAETSAHDEWRKLLPGHITIHKDNLDIGSPIDTEVIRTFELLPDYLETTGLPIKELRLRKWMLDNRQIDIVHQADYPYPPVVLFNKPWNYFPTVIRTVFHTDDEENITSKMYFHRNHATPSGEGFWSYVNKLFDDVNTILVPKGFTPIQRHTMSLKNGYLDSYNTDEPVDFLNLQ